MPLTQALARAREAQNSIDRECGVRETNTHASQGIIIPTELAKGTRGYIENIVAQINGAYDQGWYDCSAVMIRRLLEVLIIEVFEHNKKQEAIKDTSGNYFMFGDLVQKLLTQPDWNLNRTSKKILPKLKSIGDMSAHGRRYNTHKADIEPLCGELRVAVEELLYLSGLKK